MKNCNTTVWNEALNRKDWSLLDNTKNVNEAVKIYSTLMKEALDEVAPIKNFKVRSNYIFGISEATKSLMDKRDLARQEWYPQTRNRFGIIILLNLIVNLKIH